MIEGDAKRIKQRRGGPKAVLSAAAILPPAA
jgi:hypothetical protein